MYLTLKHFIKHSSLKPLLVTTLFCGITLISPFTNAASSSTSSPNNNTPIDISSMNITTHELALMQVLSEVCPQLLKQNQQTSFQTAYNNKLQELMPSISNPQNAIRYLSSQKDYRDLHDSMKTWTLSFSRAENQALCEDIAISDF